VASPTLINRDSLIECQYHKVGQNHGCYQESLASNHAVSRIVSLIREVDGAKLFAVICQLGCDGENFAMRLNVFMYCSLSFIQ
jgi:hypothetical protein